MLLLSRHVNQSVMIGDNIEVKILRIDGSQVQLGISAPKNIPVHREEIYKAIKSENVASSLSTRQDLTQAIKSLKSKKKRK